MIAISFSSTVHSVSLPFSVHFPPPPLLLVFGLPVHHAIPPLCVYGALEFWVFKTLYAIPFMNSNELCLIIVILAPSGGIFFREIFPSE